MIINTSKEEIKYGVFFNGSLIAIFLYRVDAKRFGCELENTYPDDTVSYKEVQYGSDCYVYG